jgi:hypothetical protein
VRNEDDTPGGTTSPAGDSYPATARWAAHLIDQPYSAANSGVPVIGMVRMDGQDRYADRGAGHWLRSSEAASQATSCRRLALGNYFRSAMEIVTLDGYASTTNTPPGPQMVPGKITSVIKSGDRKGHLTRHFASVRGPSSTVGTTGLNLRVA